jgi:Mg-chelatase subunit ChlD
MAKIVILLFSSFLFHSAIAFAQPSFYEVEPNNTPSEAAEFTGEVVLIGTMSRGDQDGFKWTVSDVDAQERWTLELQGIPGKLTVVDVIRVDYADNGVDVLGTERLFTIGSRDGLSMARIEDLLFEPGEYTLGFASNGGGTGLYRPPADSIKFGKEMGTAEAATDTTEPGAYRLSIRKGNSLHQRSNPQDRASKESAINLRLGSADAAYLETPISWYQLEPGEAESGKRWDIIGQVPVGRQAQVKLHSPDGTVMAATTADREGKFSFPDLGLEVGTYHVELSGEDGGYIRSVESVSVGQLVEGGEAEPNDYWEFANRIDPAQTITGRMGKANEKDYFRFLLDENLSDQVLSLQLETAEGQELTLCLTDELGKDIQCRKGSGDVELSGLVLNPGIWGLSVRKGPEGTQYSISLTGGAKIVAGIEAEPNDKVKYATSIPAKNRIKGRFSGKDTDYYTILVTDEPQLWRIQVIGEGIHELAYYDGAGIENQRFRVPQGQRRVRLDNVFMLPGIHHIRVSGTDGGSYTLLARPLGPANPNGEVEPNDDASRMQPLRMGQTRSGLLEDKQDRDFYRFFLGNWDRIKLTIQPPVDGEIQANLFWDNSLIKQFNRPEPGKQFELEGIFPPGDYRLVLSAKTISEAEYKVSLKRLDFFDCPTDCEPNDKFSFASEFPKNHIIEGRVNQWRDDDWFKLPLFDQATEVTLESEVRLKVNVVRREDLHHNVTEWDAEAKLFRGTLDPGQQYYVQVRGSPDSAYRMAVDFSQGPTAVVPASAPEFTLALNLEGREVAAYRAFAQQLEGSLNIANISGQPITVLLEAATSDHRWGIKLDKSSITIPAESELTTPISLQVPPDAWGARPVRITARAMDENNAQVTASTEVTAGAETIPVKPRHGWSIPTELLGGFNVAHDAFGGLWVGEENSAIGSGFSLLLDGMAVENEGLKLRGGQETDKQIVIDLAGDEPVEVLGLIINELSGARTDLFLRNVDFSLSLDGTEFISVITDELLPIKSEQAFVLRQPVAARFARLQLKHGFSSAAYPAFNLGEIKVIARPGLDITNAKGFNLADPLLGGHVAWSNPPTTRSNNWDKLLLTDPKAGNRVRLKPGQTQDFVVGFQHVRAAQITRIEWQDVASLTSDEKFKQVSLSVSVDSPLGPWQALGDWDLSNATSPAVYELEKPVWARYVKFSATSGGTEYTYNPAVIRIWERPVDADYLSILGEWGFASQAAIYEQQHPLQFNVQLEAAGNTSKETAVSLQAGNQVSGRVALGKQEHWYKVNIPDGDNTLTIAVSGEPTVRTVALLENSKAEPQLMRKIPSQSSSQKHTYEALVESGQSYFIKLEEPARNVVFLWDTSASVGAYLPVIYTSLLAYAEGVVPGRDSVNMIPFGGNMLLRDWYGEPYVLQTVLNDYARKDNSSAAEAALAQASKALEPRAGTKAIVMITDAATGRYPTMWDHFERVQPRIFALGLGSQGAFGGNPPLEQDLMQDWSRVNGGHYTHMLSAGDMEIAFDRASSMLRRPAAYSLEVSTAYREAPGPGRLKVLTENAGSSGSIELILDASGSMLKRLDGKRRITIAKEVLTDVVNQHIPAGTPVALRVFGHKQPNACHTDLEMALQPLDVAAAARIIQSVKARNLAKTPIADSLAMIESDLKTAKGRKVIVLVTDGEETCEGKPEQVIRNLQSSGMDLALNIVGFAIDDAGLEAQFQDWAKLGSGRYFSANSQEGLSDALLLALKIPYTIYDSSGAKTGEGVVGGEAVELEQGFYRVVVHTTPVQTFQDVEITGEQEQLIEY